MKAISSVAVVFAALAAPAPASAKIACNGNFQLVSGAEISTPYCRDNNLARVARARGFTVSDNEVRNNPNRKREICRYLRNDIEVDTACKDVDGGFDRGR